MSSCQGLAHPKLHHTHTRHPHPPGSRGGRWRQGSGDRAANRERPHWAWAGIGGLDGNAGILDPQ